MLVYRITKTKNAADISGMGAALYPGRWNKKGTPVLYTGINKEIALLENLVHLPAMMMPELDVLTIEIPNESITKLDADDLPKSWFHFPAPSILAEIGQNWVDENKTLALQVPSAIVQSSWNIVLNCRHIQYKEVKIVSRSRFHFDTRLLKY
jgi:RES domain-containing protein